MQLNKNPVKKEFISLISIILVLIAAGLISGCDEKAPAKKRSAKTLPAVETAQAEVQSLDHKILPQNKISRSLHPTLFR